MVSYELILAKAFKIQQFVAHEEQYWILASIN